MKPSTLLVLDDRACGVVTSLSVHPSILRWRAHAPATGIAGAGLRCIGVLLGATLTAAAHAHYEVRVAPGAPGPALEMSLALPSDVAVPTRLAPRGAAWGLTPQVSDVRCGQVPLSQDTDGHWVAPAGCTAVTWRVAPDPVPPEGVDASAQRTWAVGSRPWYLLAEPTSLLRPVDTDAATVIRAAPGSLPLLGATPVQPGAFRVPPATGAPEFYVVGRPRVSQRQVGAFTITDVADDASTVRWLGLQALHAKALNALLRAVPVPTAGAAGDRSLMVVWLGVAESRGRAGGAAGSRSFVANYVRGQPANDRRNAALTTMVLAHEQFHQLVDLARSDRPPQPTATWIEESLAHYYGLKALEAADGSKSAQEVRARFIDPARPVEHGLLELNRRHAAGDPAAYGLFYSQGATFWHLVDSAIVAATQGRQSLDSHLGDLLHLPIAEDGALPTSFVDRLRPVVGSRIDEVVAKYVGTLR